jgi:PAS domain S-box-containing protein
MVGRFRELDGAVYFPAIAAIRQSGRVLGYLTYWRKVNRAPSARGPIAQLIGSDALMLMGSPDGAWMSEVGPAEPPRLDGGPTQSGLYRYDRPEGPVLAAAAEAASTPWMVVVEFPARVVSGPAARFLSATAPIGLAVLLAGLVLAWLLSRQVTRPLAELTLATEAMTSGDRATRVAIDADDEVGRLSLAFNRLAQRLDQEASARAGTESQWRSVFDASPHPKWVYDAENGRILAVNPAALKGYGYTSEEFLALRHEDLVSPVAGIDELGIERHRLKGGRQIDVEAATTAITFAGRPACAVIAQNVTERTQLEARFRQAQKMQAIGRLAGGVAHDFNNFLTAIGAYAELVRETFDPGDQRGKDLEEILRATAQANRLTRQLLAFSRQEVVQPTVIDIDSAVHAMGELLRRLIPEDIELTVELKSRHVRVRMDPGHLEQVLMNLVVNARDAMPKGGTLKITTGRRQLDEGSARLHGLTEPGEYAMLSVVDDGAGMSEEVKARIFEPFFTTKDPGHGTGLGLATVYGILDQTGGRITLYSEVGQGTTFHIYLPVAQEEATLDPPRRMLSSDLKGTETILLVEDEASVRNAAQEALRRQGYQVLPASNAAEALALVAQHQGTIHLVVSDVVMPKMDGPTLIGQLRQLRPEMRALLMSGYSGGALARADGNGYDVPFLEKPFTVLALAKKVREVLGGVAPEQRTGNRERQ